MKKDAIARPVLAVRLHDVDVRDDAGFGQGFGSQSAKRDIFAADRFDADGCVALGVRGRAAVRIRHLDARARAAYDKVRSTRNEAVGAAREANGHPDGQVGVVRDADRRRARRHRDRLNLVTCTGMFNEPIVAQNFVELGAARADGSRFENDALGRKTRQRELQVANVRIGGGAIDGVVQVVGETQAGARDITVQIVDP